MEGVGCAHRFGENLFAGCLCNVLIVPKVCVGSQFSQLSVECYGSPRGLA